MNFRDIINNKYYLSFTLGILVSIIVYVLEYKKEDSKLKRHLKIFIVSSIMILISLFLSNSSHSRTTKEISSGGGLDLKLEDLNLDDPFSA